MGPAPPRLRLSRPSASLVTARELSPWGLWLGVSSGESGPMQRPEHVSRQPTPEVVGTVWKPGRARPCPRPGSSRVEGGPPGGSVACSIVPTPERLWGQSLVKAHTGGNRPRFRSFSLPLPNQQDMPRVGFLKAKRKLDGHGVSQNSGLPSAAGLRGCGQADEAQPTADLRSPGLPPCPGWAAAPSRRPAGQGPQWLTAALSPSAHGACSVTPSLTFSPGR